MSAAKHAMLAEYIKLHKKNWDLDVKVVMPGEAGKQLFEKYPLSDQSVVARAHGRKGGRLGGKAGKGKPKQGATAKGVKRAPQTGKAAKGVKRAPNTGEAAKGKPNKGGKAKGVPNTGKSAKGAANWRCGVMQTPEELLLALQQDISSRSC
jgi:hypothetical protein